MAIKRRQNFIGQQRIDAPHLKSIESAISNDFDELLSGLITGEGKSYLLRGFKINMPGSIGASASGLQLLVENTAFLHGASDESGTFYTIPAGTPAEILSSTTNTRVEGAFTPNTENYIGIEFVRNVDDTTTDQVYFWNPTTNIEFTKTVPLALILDYKIVISTSSHPANTLPVAIVETDTANNVIDITDKRQMLYRLGTAGTDAPDPFYEYEWADGRAENFYTSNSSTSDPFAGGDKQIGNMKDFFDALMTELKLLKGTPFWYSDGAGSVLRARQDLGNTAFTGKGILSHGKTMFTGQVAGMTTDVFITASQGDITLTADSVKDIDTLISESNVDNPDNTVLLSSGDGSQVPTADIVLVSTAGQINWTSDVFFSFIGGRLQYKFLSNVSSSDIVLADDQAAYVKLVRGIDVIPNLVFTNGGTVVTSVGAVPWTTDLVAGDFIKDASKGDEFYYEIASVDSLSQITLTETFGETSSGPSGLDVQYAFGVYESNAAPSTDRHIKISDRKDVPFNQDTFWLYLRKDDGSSVPKAYIRMLGGQELEQGENKSISDNTSKDILLYIGSSSESDNTPNYLESITAAETEVTTFTLPPVSSITTGQSFKIYSASDINKYYVWFNKDGGGGDPNIAGFTSVEVAVVSGDLNTAVATKVHTELNGLADFNSIDNADGTITITNAVPGATTDASNINVGGPFNATVDTQGAGEANHYVIDGENLTKGIKRLDAATFGVSQSLSGLQDDVNQNANLKLVAGGTWSWDLVAEELTWSADAYVSIGGRQNARNTVLAATATLTANQVAYTTVNRTNGPDAVVAVSVSDISALALTEDVIIIARRVGDDVIVGTSSFALKDQGFLELDGALAEINKHHGQLKISPRNPIDARIKISGSDILKLDGSNISLEQKNLLLSMPAIEIDLATGEIFESDGATPFLGGINDFAPAVIGANEYFFYSISVLPNTVNADNTISGQVLVLPAASSNAVLGTATKAPFPSSGIKLANVYVQEDGSGGLLGITYANIIQLGVGGSGSGSGDANELLERLKNRVDLVDYDVVNAVVFSNSEEDLTDGSTTAKYDITNASYNFVNIGDEYISIQLLDSVFLNEEKDIQDVELVTYWDIDQFDPLAVYEVSRDGGNEYQVVTTERIGNSDTVFGRHVFAEEATFSEIVEHAVDDVYADMTDTIERRSQAFAVASQSTFKKLFVRGNVTGFATMKGRLTVQIVKDNAGVPSTDSADIMAESVGQDLSSFGSDGDWDIEVAITASLPAGTYHIVYKTDAEYRANWASGVTEFALRVDSADTVPSKEYAAAAWGASVSGQIMYRLEGRLLDLRLKITSATADVNLFGYGMFYDIDDASSIISGGYERYVIKFSGDLDKIFFPISEFTPDPLLLGVYEVETGQVYRRGAWQLDGTTIEFPTGTFDKPGEEITLEFFQLFGGSLQFDARNRQLMAENHLGSANPSSSLSAPGRGIILERPDGTLREITINDDDNIEIKTVP